MKLHTSHFAPGARASARFSSRPTAVSKTFLALNSIRPLKRLERRAPASRVFHPLAFETFGNYAEFTINGSLTNLSFQPPAQFRRISRTMPDGADNHLGSLVFNDEKYRIWPRGGHFCFLSQPTGKGKAGGVLANGFEKSLQIFGEFLTDSRLAPVIEFNGFGKFPFRLRLDGNAQTHRPARNCFSRSATTSSSGRQRSGCASARSARRSSSAICSGVSRSSNLSRSCSKTSRCSSNGSRSSCSKTWIWAALMDLIYPVTGAMQMKTQPRATAILS